MAGILDEVMDGIAAKDKGKKEETKTTNENDKNSTADKTENPMNTYNDQFKEKYGERKNT